MTELERALVALGRELEMPEAPDVVSVVRARIERPRRRMLFAGRRRVVAAVALVLLALLGATLAVPEARSALLRVLHIGGERIELVDELPEVPVAPAGIGVVPGEIVTLADARRRAGFDLRLPADQPAPDGVYLGTRGTVWLLWGKPDRVRLLVAETPQLRLGGEVFLKKLVLGGTSVERVSVDGNAGFFLSGRPHFVILLDRSGAPVQEVAWLARNVLVWEQGGTAIRLEGDFTRDEALALAHGLR